MNDVIKALDDVIEEAELDQRNNNLSRVSEITLTWLYKARARAIEAIRKQEETVNE